MTTRRTDDGGRVNSFTVTEAEAGRRLDVLVAAHLGVSRNRAAARILAGDVRVDGRPAAKQQRTRCGQRVDVAEEVAAPPAPAPSLPPVRYRDEHLLVVAKPAGLVVHPGAGHEDGTLVDALRDAGIPLAAGDDERRPDIVHRLDRDTSGLLLVASSEAARTGLIAALQAREVERRYLALVAGSPRHPRGRIDAPIGRDPRSRTRFAVTLAGRPAVTRYRVLATGAAPDLPEHRAEVALLACRLETGRTHQIRVHLDELGHPIVGDPTYGPRRDLATALVLDRPFLHAAALGFAHPVTGQRVELEEPLPADLVAATDLAGVRFPASDASW